MTKPAKSKSSDLSDKSKDSIRIDKEAFSIGDSILVKGDGAELPFVGQIKAFKHGRKDTQVRVAWYYRPEECKDGRKQFHGEKELFKSDHMDWIDAQTISGKCTVHTLNSYRELEDESETDFFSRFSYMPSQDKFGPESVPVYCICELPYNPDTYMIMCEKCEEWYHPRCIGLTAEQVEIYNNTPFSCPACVKRKRKE